MSMKRDEINFFDYHTNKFPSRLISYTLSLRSQQHFINIEYPTVPWIQLQLVWEKETKKFFSFTIFDHVYHVSKNITSKFNFIASEMKRTKYKAQHKKISIPSAVLCILFLPRFKIISHFMQRNKIYIYHIIT